MWELNNSEKLNFIKNILWEYSHYTEEKRAELKLALEECQTEIELNCKLSQYEEEFKIQEEVIIN